MGTKSFEERLKQLSQRIRDAISRGPMGLEKGYVGLGTAQSGDSRSAEENKSVEQPSLSLNAFDKLGDAASRIRDISQPKTDHNTEESNSFVNAFARLGNGADQIRDLAEGMVVASKPIAPAPEPEHLPQIETLPVGVQASANEPVGIVVYSSQMPQAAEPPTETVVSSEPQNPSLMNILEKMGARAFCEAVQDTLSFDRARAGAGTGFNFRAAQARTSSSDEPAKPVSYEDKSALRKIIRDAVAVHGLDKVEDTLRTILTLEDKQARQVREASLPSNVSVFAHSTLSMADEPSEIHAKKHLDTTMSPDWTPAQESPENVALVDRHLAQGEKAAQDEVNAKQVWDKIENIHGLEEKLAHAVMQNPNLISDEDIQNENRWSPHAHDLASKAGFKPTSAMIKLAESYNLLVGFLKSATTPKAEPEKVEPPTVVAARAPKEEVSEGKITGGKGVYYHHPLKMS